MTISLDEFRAKVRETPKNQERIAELRALIQEPPRMEALTGRLEWNHNLRYIEAQIKLAEGEITVRRAQAATLVLTEPEKARAAAVAVVIFETRAETLKEVIMLPRYLIENGAKAKKSLRASKHRRSLQ